MPALPATFFAAASLTSAATLGLLRAEARDSVRGVWLFKPLAALGFVAAALAADATASTYGTWILIGLLFSFAGDVFLIPRNSDAGFLAGLTAFLLGHLAYAGAFLSLGFSATGAGIAALALAAPFVLTLRWLRPHLEGSMKAAVPVYTTVICAMGIAAGSAFALSGNGTALAGALLFQVSDLAVAREQFVEQTLRNKLWGLPFYFGAQLLLAASIATF